MTNRRLSHAPPKELIRHDKKSGLYALNDTHSWSLHPTKGWKRRRHSYAAPKAKLAPIVRALRNFGLSKGHAA